MNQITNSKTAFLPSFGGIGSACNWLSAASKKLAKLSVVSLALSSGMVEGRSIDRQYHLMPDSEMALNLPFNASGQCPAIDLSSRCVEVVQFDDDECSHFIEELPSWTYEKEVIEKKDLSEKIDAKYCGDDLSPVISLSPGLREEVHLESKQMRRFMEVLAEVCSDPTLVASPFGIHVAFSRIAMEAGKVFLHWS